MTSSYNSFKLVGAAPKEGSCICPHATHVLFDLDGTISLMRGGWAQHMLSIFLKKISPQPGETPEQLQAMLLDDMMRQNGKPSVFQFVRFSERLVERGGKPIDPQKETDAFVRELQVCAQQRRQAVLSGQRSRESILVPGVLTFLHLLQERGLTLWLASGTDEKIVQPELEELGLKPFFGERTYAYRPGFSKVQVIEKILSQPSMSPDQLVSFGDGFVEIHETAQRGGVAVAVASDESWVDLPPYQGSGRMDTLKEALLVEAGARVVTADYADAEKLANIIFGKR